MSLPSLLALLLAPTPVAAALPPMALPSAEVSQRLDRAEVDHILVVSLAFVQMDSQPMLALDQGLLPLAGRPGLDAAMAVAQEPSGRCIPERSLLVVLDRRVPALTQSAVEQAVSSACFETRWLLVAPRSQSVLAQPSAPVELGQDLAVVPFPQVAEGPGGPGTEPTDPAPFRDGPPPLGEGGSSPQAPAPRIAGALDAAALDEALKGADEAIAACAKGETGLLVLRFAVNNQGHPKGVQVQSSTMQDPEIGLCIANVVGGLSLPAGQEAQAVVLPLALP